MTVNVGAAAAAVTRDLRFAYQAHRLDGFGEAFHAPFYPGL
jgi:hypothetical protein